jgi:hypothetical protein
LKKKNRSDLFFQIQRKYCSFGHTEVLKLQFFFVLTEHIKIFKTKVFLETVVFLEYFENALLPNTMQNILILARSEADYTANMCTIKRIARCKETKWDYQIPYIQLGLI